MGSIPISPACPLTPMVEGTALKAAQSRFESERGHFMVDEANGKHLGCDPSMAQAYAGSSPVVHPWVRQKLRARFIDPVWPNLGNVSAQAYTLWIRMP